MILGDYMNGWSRLEELIGTNKLNRLKQSTVLVLGVGGVGSSAVEHLSRNGIGKIILVDYDIIDITNLNRQVMTLHSNVGKRKVEVLKKRIEDISKDIKVSTICEKITEENIELLFQEPIHFIIDACDIIRVKKEVIRRCIKYCIPLISCMGTGNKKDPTKVKIMDIRKTSYDPIAKIIRKMVREEKISKKIMVVTSDEVPLKKKEVIASNSFVPNTAGMLASYYVVSKLIEGDCYESK